jgi:hypothetical protein
VVRTHAREWADKFRQHFRKIFEARVKNPCASQIFLLQNLSHRQKSLAEAESDPHQRPSAWIANVDGKIDSFS